MLMLAFESSAKPASVAVCSDGALLGQYYMNCGLTHSRTLLAMAECLLRNLGIDAKEINAAAVARGPGSFTGVRIGVAAAKGFAWGLDIPVYGVSTLEAMASQAPISDALLCPVMDARRNQVYNALFVHQGGKLSRLCEDRAISLPGLASELSGRVCLIGDGAGLAREHLATTIPGVFIAPELLRHQTAFGVAIAAGRAKPVSASELEPSYLRPSQAEQAAGGGTV